MKSAPKPPNSIPKTHLPAKPQQGSKAGPPVRPNLAPTAASRQTFGPSVAQKKTATSAVRQAPAAPPVYRPQPVPKVLQTKMATTKPAHEPRKTPTAPPVYRPQPPRIQAKFAGPPVRPNLMHKGVIQRHPLTVTIEREDREDQFHTDTDNFQSIHDVTQHLPAGAANYAVDEIHVRKEKRADHQYVIATTNGGINLKMHLGAGGAEIKCGADISPHFGDGIASYNPLRGLTLGDAVGIFYQLAHKHRFESDTYNCQRFAADLAGNLGTFILEGSDLDGFL